MVWKIINIDSPGSSITYGGDDLKKVMRLLSGYDLKTDDVTDEVQINTDTTFQSEKFRIQSPTTGFNYIFRGQDITADRIISLPLMSDDGEISLSAAGTANDWGAFMQTFRHQNLKLMNPANTFGYIFNSSAITANRNITLPLLTSDDTIVTLAATQTLTNKTLTSPTISAMTVNTDSNTIKHSTTNNSGDLLVNTGTKFDRFARGAADQVPIMNATGTALTWIDKASLAGSGGGSVTGDYQVPTTVNNVITGAWYGNSAAGGSGLWADFLTSTGNVSPVDIADGTGRMGNRYNCSVDDDRVGFRTNGTHFCRMNNPELIVRYRIDNVGGTPTSSNSFRVVIGFTTDPSADYGSDGQLASKSCFMWFKETADADIRVARNDGDTTPDYDTGVSLAQTNTSVHTIRVFGDSANNRFGVSLDGANATYYTTEIPASTTRLGTIVQFEQEGADDRSFEIFGATFRAKVL